MSVIGSSLRHASVTEPRSSPFNPLIKRLSMFVPLGPDEQAAIEAITRGHRAIGSGEMLVREGSRPDRVCLILDGAAYRHRYLSDGRRQILGYLLPGDLCDTQFIICNECDHMVGMLCNSQIAIIPIAALIETMVRFPLIERGLLMMSLVEAATAREWLLNVGQRDAFQRLGHLFCELSKRFEVFGKARSEDGVDIPLTQRDLADTMGLTTVHVNRVLQRLRREDLLELSRKHFRILDFERLSELSGFNPRYLRLK
jgi:CRP-like cAMP-binding protein